MSGAGGAVRSNRLSVVVGEEKEEKTRELAPYHWRVQSCSR